MTNQDAIMDILIAAGDAGVSPKRLREMTLTSTAAIKGALDRLREHHGVTVGLARRANGWAYVLGETRDAQRAKDEALVLDCLRAGPSRGLPSRAIAPAVRRPLKSVQRWLQALRKRGAVDLVQSCMNDRNATWVIQPAPAPVEIEYSDDRYKARMREDRRSTDDEIEAWCAAAPTHSRVSAADAEPIKKAGPASVWELVD